MRPRRAVLILAFLSLIAGCGSRAEKIAAADTKHQTVPVRTATVREANWPSLYDAVGTVKPRASSQVSSRVMAYIRDVNVAVGEHVRQGQSLITLDAREFDSRRRQADAGGAEARTAIAEADSAVESAKANLDLAEVSFRRIQNLFEKASVSNQEFDEASARLQVARANLQMAIARRKQIDSKIARADEESAAAQIQSGYSVLVAPLTGIVAEKMVEPGNLAIPGATLLTIEQEGGYRFHAQVEESKIGAIRRGQTAQVSLDSFDRTFTGLVSEVTPTVDPGSHSFLVKVDLPYSSGLRSGLFGRAQFPVGARKVVLIPASAVAERGQMRWVFVTENGVARTRIVTVGDRREDQIEALSGIQPDEQVIFPAPQDLSDGDPVETIR